MTKTAAIRPLRVDEGAKGEEEINPLKSKRCAPKRLKSAANKEEEKREEMAETGEDKGKRIRYKCDSK